MRPSPWLLFWLLFALACGSAAAPAPACARSGTFSIAYGKICPGAPVGPVAFDPEGMTAILGGAACTVTETAGETCGRSVQCGSWIYLFHAEADPISGSLVNLSCSTSVTLMRP
jgi:hypothetical protein